MAYITTHENQARILENNIVFKHRQLPMDPDCSGSTAPTPTHQCYTGSKTEYLPSLTKLIEDPQQTGTQIKNYFQTSSITFLSKSPESIPRRKMAPTHSLQPWKLNL